MKVTKLHIDEYKVFKDFDIDFTDKEGKAQNLIVLAGINGTGKTTLLELIYNTIFRKLKDQFSKDESYIAISYTPVFELNRLSDPQKLLYLYTFQQLDIKSWLTTLFKKHVYLFRVGELKVNDVSSIIVKYIDSCIYEKNMKAFDAYERLRNFLNSILLEFSLSVEFNSLTADRIPVFTTAKSEKVSFEALSSGEKQMLSYVLQIFVKSVVDSIILIDEPEFSLHPSWQNKIVGVLQKYADEYNCQVILATHSPHIIGSVHSKKLRLLYKDESGAIKVVENSPNAYGMTFDRVLSEVMGVENLRTPKVEEQLNELHELVKKNEYNSDLFHAKMKEMEHIIGYSDRDLILMRFEVAKKAETKCGK